MKYVVLLAFTIVSCVPYSLMQHQTNSSDYDLCQQQEEDKQAVREELDAESQNYQTQRDIDSAIVRARLKK